MESLTRLINLCSDQTKTKWTRGSTDVLMRMRMRSDWLTGLCAYSFVMKQAPEAMCQIEDTKDLFHRAHKPREHAWLAISSHHHMMERSLGSWLSKAVGPTSDLLDCSDKKLYNKETETVGGISDLCDTWGESNDFFLTSSLRVRWRAKEFV